VDGYLQQLASRGRGVLTAGHNPPLLWTQRQDLEAHVWQRVAALSAKHGHDLKPADVTRDTRFTEDLGYG
jgi:hypothetical protein